jgi:multidrug efflux pump
MTVLGRTLSARGAVLLAGAAIMGASVVFFTGAARELAPQEDMGYVFVQTKAPQYANVDYTSHYSGQVDALFRTVKEYESSWFDMGGALGANIGFGGIIMDDWSKRSRNADQIQAEITGKSAAVTGVYATAFQDSPCLRAAAVCRCRW